MSTDLESKDLSNTSVEFPYFNNIWVLARTGEVRQEVNTKASPPTTNLVVPLVFEEAVTSTDGRRIEVGHVVEDNILLTPTGGLTQDMIDRKLTAFQIAALRLPGPKGCAWGSTSQYSGKMVRVYFTSGPSKRDATRTNQYVNKYEKAP